MARVASAIDLRQLATLFDSGSLTGLTDRQLLDRFTNSPATDAQGAFGALVTRHGPMVLRVCSHLLRDEHHAEDAFQAVFLILARRARSIQHPEKLANWLYGVALRTARYTRNRIEQKAQEPGQPAPQFTAHTPDQFLLNREQAEVLHDEIDRLPQHFRLAILLHYFEGLSIDEAATQLQVARGTIASRLNRAREKLKHSLTRRGFEPSTTTLITSLNSKPGSIHITAELRDQTARAAIQFATGKGSFTTASAIAMEVLKAMIVPKLKAVAVLAVMIGLTASGARILAHSLGTNASTVEQPNVKPQAAATSRPHRGQLQLDGDQPNVKLQAAAATTPKLAPGRMFVTGRVLDPAGKAVSNAAVMLYSRPRLRRVGSESVAGGRAVLANAASDATGHFQIDGPRTCSGRHEEIVAAAFAPGYAVAWTSLDPDADQPSGDITLQPEQVIDGRLFNLLGQPAHGVTVVLTGVLHVSGNDPDSLTQRFEGPIFPEALAQALPAWPKPMKTDAEGRFTLHGVGKRLRAYLKIVDARYPQQTVFVDTDDKSPTKVFNLALEPARFVNCRVTYADTGMPVPHAEVISDN